jgi:flagellin-like protein
MHNLFINKRMLHGQGGKNVMTLMKKRKAISPVIATVILVAVAITVAVGVSYWMGGISSQYTQFEKVEIATGYATNVVVGNVTGWEVTLEIKNSGSAAATITHVFVNEVPVDVYGAGALGAAGTTCTDILSTGLSLTAGAPDTVIIWIASGGGSTLSSGTTVNIKLHSAGGMDYIRLVKLP